MENVKVIGSFLIMACAAISIYMAWSISTEKAIYGRLGKPPWPVVLFAAVEALLAIVGVVIVFNL